MPDKRVGYANKNSDHTPKVAKVVMDSKVVSYIIVFVVIALLFRSLRGNSRRASTRVHPASKIAPPAGPAIHTQDEFFDLNGKGAYEVQAVGESHYQESLRSIVAGRKGYVQLHIEAQLYCEDDNAYDSNAVCVKIQGKTVGYLSREIAAHYRTLINNAGFGKATGRCQARIYGGSDAKPSYGVWLDI